MLYWFRQETIVRLVSTLGNILSRAQPSYTKILTLLITHITEIWRMLCTLEKCIAWIKFIPNCDITCLVYVKLKLIGKILILLQQTWNRVVGYLYPIINCMIVCFIHFHHVHSILLVYVRHFLNHTIVVLAPPWPSILGSHLVRLMVAPPWLWPSCLAHWAKKALGKKLMRNATLREVRWS